MPAPCTPNQSRCNAAQSAALRHGAGCLALDPGVKAHCRNARQALVRIAASQLRASPLAQSQGLVGLASRCGTQDVGVGQWPACADPVAQGEDLSPVVGRAHQRRDLLGGWQLGRSATDLRSRGAALAPRRRRRGDAATAQPATGWRHRRARASAAAVRPPASCSTAEWNPRPAAAEGSAGLRPRRGRVRCSDRTPSGSCPWTRTPYRPQSPASSAQPGAPHAPGPSPPPSGPTCDRCCAET